MNRLFQSSAVVLRRQGTRCLVITDGLPQGRVVPRKFDYIRPQYTPPTFPLSFIVFNMWWQLNYLPNVILCFAFVWGIHGGFTGHLPPDPHDLWH